VVAYGGKAEQHHHFKVATVGVLAKISDKEEKGCNEENVNPIDPRTLALLDFSIGSVQVIEEDDNAEAEQDIKDGVGNLRTEIADEQEGGAYEQGVEQVIVKVR
jgi:hypothetical protein